MSYKVIKEIVRKYYKYITFEQPTITENGTMGGSTFACYRSGVYDNETSLESYKAFDNDSNTKWAAYNYTYSSNSWISFYNPIPLNVTSLQITNGTGGYWAITSGSIQASNDNINWITLKSYTNSSTGTKDVWDIDLSNNNEYYKYYKIIGNCAKYQIEITQVNITAKYIQESTSTDYDYYKDIDVYKIPKINNKYYAINQ